MKSFLFLVALRLACPLFAAKSTPPIAVYFSPQGGCTEAVVAELGKAQKSVYAPDDSHRCAIHSPDTMAPLCRLP